MQMLYKILNIEIEDVNHIKKVYRDGEENNGDLEHNPYNTRVDKNTYNTNLVKSETFFCDTSNKELVNVIKKYIGLNEMTEYISNIHYINYKIGEEAKEHVDTGKSIRTYIILLNSDFEGGEFYLEGNHVNLKIGQIMEFDANLLHSVKTITNGNREVIVIWVKNSQKKDKSLI